MQASQVFSLNSLSLKERVALPVLQILAATLFLAICARISIPNFLGFIPLTGQAFGVMLIGYLLGSRKAALTVIAYIVEGLSGLPVFAGGGCGILYFFGPTAGYLIGFVLQAYLVGWYFERRTQFRSGQVFSFLYLTELLQMSLGVLWIALSFGLKFALAVGLYPFLLSEALKVLLLTSFLRNLPAKK